MNKSLVLAAVIAAVALSACGKKEEAPMVEAPAAVVVPAPTEASVAVDAAAEKGAAAVDAAAAAGTARHPQAQAVLFVGKHACVPLYSRHVVILDNLQCRV